MLLKAHDVLPHSAITTEEAKTFFSKARDISAPKVHGIVSETSSKASPVTNRPFSFVPWFSTPAHACITILFIWFLHKEQLEPPPCDGSQPFLFDE